MRFRFALNKKLNIVGLFLLLILVITQIYAIESLYVPVPESKKPENELIMESEESNLPNNELLEPNLFNGDTVFGEGLRVTPTALPQEGFSVARDNEGKYHCIWVEKYTTYGASLFYSYTNDTLGMEWSRGAPIYRVVEESINSPKLMIDNQKTLHIIIKIQKSPYDHL